MTSTTLLLGPVVFQDFEIPCGINFGGKQRLAIHRLPGGLRVIDALGRDDADIRFEGIFSGTDATLRARLLDEMRVSGLFLPLTWDVFFYTVVISQFQADYATSNWIPYKISCTVLRDEAGALIESALSLGATVLSDVTTAAAQASLGGVDISSLQTSMSDPSATVRDTAAYGQAQTALTGAQSQPGEHHRCGCNGIADFSRHLGRHSGERRCQPDECGRRSTASQSADCCTVLCRTGRNQPGKREHLIMITLTVAGGNLFQIAAQQLNDATQWIRIAQLNAIHDPMLSGVVTLLIPDIDVNAGGGIAAQ